MICEKVHITPESGKNERKTFWVIILTVVMMVAEITAGLLFGSLALLSDGIHMGTHTLALLITLIAYWIARKNAQNSRFAFGTGKVGVLGGYTSAIALMIAALVMVGEAIDRLFNPVEIGFNESIIVAIIGLIVNLVSAVLLHQGEGGEHHHHEHSHGHHHHHDHNLKAAYLHVIADALTSVLAIAALLVGKFYGAVWLDPLVGIVGAAVILKWAIGLLRSTGEILLDYEGDDALREHIISDFHNAGVREIRDMHLWQIGEGRRMLMVTVDSDVIPDDKLSDMRVHLGICHLTIEYV